MRLAIGLAVALLVSLAAGAEARGYMALGYTIIELDDVVRAGGSREGTALIDGREHRAVLTVERRGWSSSYGPDYDFELAVYRPGETEKPRVRVRGTLRAQSSVRYEGSTLTLDVRDYPEEAKSVWTFDLTGAGTLGGVHVKKDGFLGIGAREVHCRLK